MNSVACGKVFHLFKKNNSSIVKMRAKRMTPMPSVFRLCSFMWQWHRLILKASRDHEARTK